jgi:photosystem II stability/assembly factor-like uncharacterized protein
LLTVVLSLCLLGAVSHAQNPAQTAPETQPAAAPAPTQAAAAQPAITADDFNQFSWRWIGPMTFSGRMTAFAVPRGQSQTYYVLTASGGLWKTEDGGTRFEPIFEKGDTLSMGWMAIAPSNQNVLYLGTGEPMHARSSTHGKGMWKSTDAGKTWTKIGLEKSYFIPKVEVDSKNPDIVFVAAEGKLYDNEMDCERGLYKSTDGGKTWTNIFTPMTDRGVGDFVIDPTNSDVIIAAAYKTFRRAWTYIDRHAGNDLYKTTDGGKTWKKLTNGIAENVARGRTGLAIYEKNPKIVYARLDEEVVLGFPEREGVASFRAPGAGGGRGGAGGGGAMGGTLLFRPDASMVTLKAYKMPAEMAKLLSKFALVPVEKDADVVKALNDMIADKDFLTKNAIDIVKLQTLAKKLHAKDDDVIASIAEIEKLMKLEPAKPDSTEAKARQQILNRHALELIYAGQLTILQPTKRNGMVYRSDDQGDTWKAMTEYKMTGGSAQVNQTEGGYYGRIIIDPNDDKVVYCGDTNTTVSRDSGKTFAVTGWDGTGKTHVDHRVVWVDPLNSNHILSGNDGATSETWNGGKTWSQKNGIRAQQFYDLSVDNEQPYNVMGGTQDNGAWIGPSQNRNSYGMFANDWRYLPTGDGFYVVRDWWNPDWIYYESQFGNSSRQNLRTGETSPLAVRLTPDEVAAGEPALRYQWNAPIVLSPHNPGIVYIASQYVWRSLSRGEPGSFQRISPDLTKASKEKIALSRKTNLQWATVYSFAESVKKPGLYWAGTDDGNVQVSTDSGATWTNITNQFYDAAGKVKPGVKGDVIPYDRWVKRVVPSAHDENTCYVAFSGYRTHNEDKTWLYVTKDLGKTWTSISGGMDHAIFDVEEDPDNANVLYLGTENGIWVTIDHGTNWTAFTSSQPIMVIRDLAIQKRDREMAIGTYARGFFIADIGPIREFKPEVFQSPAYLFEPTDAVKWSRFERRGETLGELVKADNPPVGTNIYYYLGADAKNVKLTIKDLEGAVLQDYTPAEKKGLQKHFWNLSRQAAPGAAAAGAAGGGGGRGGFAGRNLMDPGVYKVTLTVDGKEIATKKLTVLPDPMFK